MKVVTLGEALICLDSGGQRLESAVHLTKSVGGAESNAAIGLARLGHDCRFVGRVGADPLGTQVQRTLRGEGVDVSALVRDPERATGLLLKQRRGPRDVSVYYHRRGSAGAALDVGDVPVDAVAQSDLLHVTGVTLALGSGARKAVALAVEVARSNGVTVTLDANFRRKLCPLPELVEHFERLAPLADHLLVGWGEGVACAGTDEPAAVEAHLRGLGAGTVVLKGPAGGATAFDAEGRHSVPPLEVAVVDPVGAGDGFAVGYLHGLLTGERPERRLALGAWATARVIGHVGDYEGLPTTDDLAALDTALPEVSR